MTSHTTRDQILNDPDLTPFARGQLLDELSRLESANPPSLPTITPDVAIELRSLGTGITQVGEALKEFDRTDKEHRALLEKTRAEVKALETPATLPDETMVMALIKKRATVELLTNFLSGSPARRSVLVSSGKSKLTQLAQRLRQVTTRTMARDFENPNLGVAGQAASAVAEIERVIEAKADAFERIPQSRVSIFT